MAKYIVDEKEKARDKEFQRKFDHQPLLKKADCKIHDDQNHEITDTGKNKSSYKPTETTKDSHEQAIFKGKSDWQIQAPGFVTGQERRLEKLQTEMRESLVNMQT